MTKTPQNIDEVVENLKSQGFSIATHGSVVIIVKNKEGKYLLLQRALNDSEGPGLYDFAGGSTDTEDPQGDAKRELFEEAGIEADALDFVDFSNYTCRWKGERKVRFIFAHETDQDVTLSFEHESFAWVEAPDVMNYEFYKDGLQELLLEHAKQD